MQTLDVPRSIKPERVRKPRRLPVVSHEAVTENAAQVAILISTVRHMLSRSDKTGKHLPTCNHRYWIGGYSNRRLHDDCLGECDGEGAPCSERCMILRETMQVFGLSEGVIV